MKVFSSKLDALLIAQSIDKDAEIEVNNLVSKGGESVLTALGVKFSRLQKQWKRPNSGFFDPVQDMIEGAPVKLSPIKMPKGNSELLPTKPKGKKILAICLDAEFGQGWGGSDFCLFAMWLLKATSKVSLVFIGDESAWCADYMNRRIEGVVLASSRRFGEEEIKLLNKADMVIGNVGGATYAGKLQGKPVISISDNKYSNLGAFIANECMILPNYRSLISWLQVNDKFKKALRL